MCYLTLISAKTSGKVDGSVDEADAESSLAKLSGSPFGIFRSILGPTKWTSLGLTVAELLRTAELVWGVSSLADASAKPAGSSHCISMQGAHIACMNTWMRAAVDTANYMAKC